MPFPVGLLFTGLIIRTILGAIVVAALVFLFWKIGNLAGAMLGGLLLGVIESLGAGYIGDITGGFLGSNYQDVFAFFVLILVLVFRPSGLLGERVVERA